MDQRREDAAIRRGDMKDAQKWDGRRQGEQREIGNERRDMARDRADLRKDRREREHDMERIGRRRP
jgi:hypothetical protein